MGLLVLKVPLKRSENRKLKISKKNLQEKQDIVVLTLIQQFFNIQDRKFQNLRYFRCFVFWYLSSAFQNGDLPIK